MTIGLSKKMKKVVAGVLALLIVAGTVPVEVRGVRLFDTAITASAAEEVASGECGDNATWSLDDSGKLTIGGSGDMYDYMYWEPNIGKTQAPWQEYYDSIKTVEIAEGITKIGNYSFYAFELKEMNILLRGMVPDFPLIQLRSQRV